MSLVKLKVLPLTLLETFVLHFTSTITETVAAVSLILFQLAIIPCCSKYIPSLLRRMWIGFFLFLLSAVSIAIISFNVTKNLKQAKYTNAIHTCEENIWTPYMIAIQEVLSGIGFFFSITGQIEFMSAQAPQSMQGILIGITFVEFFFPYFTNYIGIVTTAGTTK